MKITLSRKKILAQMTSLLLIFSNKLLFLFGKTVSMQRRVQGLSLSYLRIDQCSMMMKVVQQLDSLILQSSTSRLKSLLLISLKAPTQKSHSNLVFHLPAEYFNHTLTQKTQPKGKLLQRLDAILALFTNDI